MGSFCANMSVHRFLTVRFNSYSCIFTVWLPVLLILWIRQQKRHLTCSIGNEGWLASVYVIIDCFLIYVNYMCSSTAVIGLRRLWMWMWSWWWLRERCVCFWILDLKSVCLMCWQGAENSARVRQLQQSLLGTATYLRLPHLSDKTATSQLVSSVPSIRKRSLLVYQVSLTSWLPKVEHSIPEFGLLLYRLWYAVMLYTTAIGIGDEQACRFQAYSTDFPPLTWSNWVFVVY